LDTGVEVVLQEVDEAITLLYPDDAEAEAEEALEVTELQEASLEMPN